MPPEETLPEGTDAIVEGAGVASDEEDGGELDEDDAEPRPAVARAVVMQEVAPADIRAAVGERVDAFAGRAGDRARDALQAAKDRATDAIGEVVRMIEDAAGEIDAKIGTQYGDYARRAAGRVDDIAATVRDKDVDALFADARTLVARSPAVAAGVAAALAFVATRIVRAAMPEQAAGRRSAA